MNNLTGHKNCIKYPLPEKCPNAEFFLVCIFLHSDRRRRFTPYISVFSPNAEKYGPETTWFLDTFDAATIISRKSLVWKFCGNAHFPQSFGRID